MKLKKSILPIALCAFMTVYSACQSPTVSVKQDAIVWSALSTDKFTREQGIESYNEAKLDFVGMKGETTALQVMLTAKTDIKSFDLKINDLTGKDGVVFSKDNIKAYAERYIDCYNHYVNPANHSNKVYVAPVGYYPDALVPLDRYIKNREAKIEKGHNQGIWVDCVIPADATPGEYAGTFTVCYGEETKDIPVTLKVYDLTMPEEVHSQTFFGLWYEQLSHGEGDNYSMETDMIYYNYLASKRLSTDDVPPEYSKDMNTYLEFFEMAAENPKVTSYLYPKGDIAFDLNILVPAPEEEYKYSTAQKEAEMMKLKNSLTSILEQILVRNMELREEKGTIDLFKKLIFAVEDEPNTAYRFSRIKKFGEALTFAKRTVAEKYATELEQEKNAGLKESLANVEQICASNNVNDNLYVSSSNAAYYDTRNQEDYVANYEKGDGLTLWCPEGFMFKDATFRETVKWRQSLGERFTWYTCCVNSPVMSYYMETIPVSMRMYSWIQYEYGIEGVLYSDTVHWRDLGDPYENAYQNGWGAG